MKGYIKLYDSKHWPYTPQTHDICIFHLPYSVSVQNGFCYCKEQKEKYQKYQTLLTERKTERNYVFKKEQPQQIKPKGRTNHDFHKGHWKLERMLFEGNNNNNSNEIIIIIIMIIRIIIKTITINPIIIPLLCHFTI